EKTGDGAKFAAVGAATAGFDRNDAEGAPAGADFLEHGIKNLWNDVELSEVDSVPGNGRIGLQRGLLLLAEGVYGSVDVFERAVCGIVHNFGPGFVSFAESYGVGMAGTAGAAERLVSHFGDVRAAHHYGDADGANGVRHAV